MNVCGEVSNLTAVSDGYGKYDSISPAFFRSRPTPNSVHVEPVAIHHLGPGLHTVSHDLLFSVSRSIDLCDGAQLGVRPKHQVNRGRRPFDLAGRAIESIVNGLGCGGLAPPGRHIEQVYEEVIAQCPGTI